MIYFNPKYYVRIGMVFHRLHTREKAKGKHSLKYLVRIKGLCDGGASYHACG